MLPEARTRPFLTSTTFIGLTILLLLFDFFVFPRLIDGLSALTPLANSPPLVLSREAAAMVEGGNVEGGNNEGPSDFVVSPASVRIPPFPERPDLFDEVKWGPFPSQEDIEKAHLLWNKQDMALFNSTSWDTMKNPPREDAVWATDNAAYCLVKAVYDHLLERCHVPLADEEWDAEAQFRLDPETGLKRKWLYEEIFGYPARPGRESESESREPEPVRQPSTRQDTPVGECPDINETVRNSITIDIKSDDNGTSGDIMNNKPGTTWNLIEKVRIEARRRGISHDKRLGSVPLRQLVYKHEFQGRWQKDLNFRKDVRQKLELPEPQANGGTLPQKDPSVCEIPRDKDDQTLCAHGSLLPREDLQAWGISRKDDYTLKISRGAELSPLDMYTWAIILSPYNPALWTSRAYLHYQMGYFGLAIGDAYRAQLLCEVVTDAQKRNRQPGLYPRIWDALERHIIQMDKQEHKPHVISFLRKGAGVPYFVPAARKAVHHIISLSLLALQCWRDYMVTEPHLTERITMPDRDAKAIKKRQEGLRQFVVDRDRDYRRNNNQEFFYERRYGYVPGRLYPYGSNPIPRATEPVCERINRDMEDVLRAHSLEKKFEVRSDALVTQVKVCATEKIYQGELIYVEEPSIRGHLHGLEPINECENCKSEVDPVLLSSEKRFSKLKCSCLMEHNQRVFWCGPPEEESPEVQSSGECARERSQKRAAGNAAGDQPNKRQKTVDAENPRPSCLDIGRALYHNRVCGKDWTWLHDAMRPIFTKDFKFMTHTNEQHGTILSLLLREVFDITLKRREVQGKPNLFAHEIDELIPLMGVEEMDDQQFPFSFAANVRVPFDILSCLGVDIFRDMTFDTWVIQLVLRKLLLNVIT